MKKAWNGQKGSKAVVVESKDLGEKRRSNLNESNVIFTTIAITTEPVEYGGGADGGGAKDPLHRRERELR